MTSKPGDGASDSLSNRLNDSGRDSGRDYSWISRREGASFRDPSGFLFTSDDILYRQVNFIYEKDYERLMESGLYQDLVQAGLLIPHEEVPAPPSWQAEIERSESQGYKFLRPEPVTFISYPYEWSFSQLKDAALTTLKIQKRALEFGMSLKDSSAYNIQFHKGRPVLIDTLSFEAYQEGKPWIAYRQFCQHFLAPLSLMAHRDVRLGQLLRVYIDGIPLDLASGLLPPRTRLIFPLLLHVHLHASSQKRYAAQQVNTSRQVSRVSFLGLLDSLESGIRSLHWSPGGTEWGSYYEETNYTSAGLEHKRRLVGEYLDQIQPGSVWDLGANTGLFSRLASSRGIPTLAFDVDPGAVEQNYLDSLSRKETSILPLLMDLTNPSPGIGWQNEERRSLLERGPAGAVLALALIHHLAIANNVPLEILAAFFKRLSPWLVIEFVPKSDSQVQRLLTTRADIFPDYYPETFETIFDAQFKIHRAETIRDSQRHLYLMERIMR